MTELLHMKDFNIETCEATIVSLDKTEDGRSVLILDKTCFYARGGGQDWDTGFITKDKANFRVDEVRLDEASDVYHIGNIVEGSFNIGDVVLSTVNHDRRSINTRLDSAGHVIDMVINNMGLDWIAGKGQHYPHLSAVEYSGSWQPEQSEMVKTEIEKKVNELINKGAENSLRFMKAEEMAKVCKHVPDNIPTNKPARVVMYGDSFGIPCGGTHVKNLNEIGMVRIPKLKQKSGIIRVSYVVAGINS